MRTPDFTRASCVGVDTKLFFPDDKRQEPELKVIRKVCNGCPIFNSCLNYALHVKVEGIWAGTIPAERIKIRKLLGIKPINIAETFKVDNHV